MAPTEILAKQHYDLATKIFKSTGVTIELLTSKFDAKEKKLAIKRSAPTLSNKQLEESIVNLGFSISNEDK